MVTRDLYYSLISCSSVFFHDFFSNDIFSRNEFVVLLPIVRNFSIRRHLVIYFLFAFWLIRFSLAYIFSTLMNLVRNIFVRLLLWTTRMLIQIVIVPFFPIVPCLLLQCIRVVNAFHGYSPDGSENQYIHNINHLFRRVYTFNMNIHCRWMDGTSEIRTNA